MFWKKKEAGAPKKEKKLSPREIIIRRVEALEPGQSISYKVLEIYGGGLGIIELNPDFPEKGKKYYIYREGVVDDPKGEKRLLVDTSKPKDIAGWVVDRGGVQFS